jgi:predicted nucleic acid-binding Zn ribbon protein
MKDQPLTTCPKCGGQLKRLIGPGAGPIFKGNGFYQTDYKNNSNNSNSGSSKKNNTKSESTVKETAA